MRKYENVIDTRASEIVYTYVPHLYYGLLSRELYVELFSNTFVLYLNVVERLLRNLILLQSFSIF